MILFEDEMYQSPGLINPAYLDKPEDYFLNQEEIEEQIYAYRKGWA